MANLPSIQGDRIATVGDNTRGNKDSGRSLVVRSVDDENETFPYEPLDQELQQIRLLRLRNMSQSRFRDLPTLRFKIEVVSLRDRNLRPYHAISYAWGALSAWAEILMDDLRVRVPESAEEALRGLLLAQDPTGRDL